MKLILKVLILLLYQFQQNISAHVKESLVKKVYISPEGPIDAAFSANLTINCTSTSSDSNDHIEWLLPKKENQNSRHHVHKINEFILQLTLMDLTLHDSGAYFCKSKKYGNTAVYVEVFPPHFMENTNKNGLDEDIIKCDSTQFACKSGHCIFHIYRCDGHIDCPYDSSDEVKCFGSCNADKFQCDNGECINKSLECDENAIRHCYDGSDEQNCKKRIFVPNIVSPQSAPVIHHNRTVFSALAFIFGLVFISTVLVIIFNRIRLQRDFATLLHTINNDRLQASYIMDTDNSITYDFSEDISLESPPPYTEVDDSLPLSENPPPYNSLYESA